MDASQNSDGQVGDAPTVLVIVGEPQLRGEMAQMLARGGYRCEEAANSDAAMASMAGTRRIAVAICDLELADAGALMDRIRAEYPATAVATVCSSGGCCPHGSPSEVPDLLCHLPDPRSPRRLLTGVMTAIHHHSQRHVDERRQHLVRSEIEIQIEQLGALTPDLAVDRFATLARLALATDSRHAEPNDHIDRLSLLVARLARRLGFPENEVTMFAAAAPLHDLGKLALPASLLAKPGPFTAEERRQMQDHAELGHALLAGTGDELLDLAATIAWTHHERWDGSGYPRRLRGDQTPIAGRIVGVATVFDALTSERVYRRALPLAEALQVIRGGSDSDFDPAVAGALVAVITEPEELADGHGPRRLGQPSRAHRASIPA